MIKVVRDVNLTILSNVLKSQKSHVHRKPKNYGPVMFKDTINTSAAKLRNLKTLGQCFQVLQLSPGGKIVKIGLLWFALDP